MLSVRPGLSSMPPATGRALDVDAGLRSDRLPSLRTAFTYFRGSRRSDPPGLAKFDLEMNDLAILEEEIAPSSRGPSRPRTDRYERSRGKAEKDRPE